jgi:hypothetical protein
VVSTLTLPLVEPIVPVKVRPASGDVPADVADLRWALLP